jgi:hypothetical protein
MSKICSQKPKGANGEYEPHALAEGTSFERIFFKNSLENSSKILNFFSMLLCQGLYNFFQNICNFQIF